MCDLNYIHLHKMFYSNGLNSFLFFTPSKTTAHKNCEIRDHTLKNHPNFLDLVMNIKAFQIPT